MKKKLLVVLMLGVLSVSAYASFNYIGVITPTYNSDLDPR